MFRVVAVCVLGLVLTSVTVRAESNDGNEIFDAILEQIRDTDAIRVLSLDDIRFGFEKKIGFLVVHGEAKLHDGIVTGLDTMHRIGDATVREFDDGSMKIKCSLGMGTVDFSYRGTVTFMDLGPSIKMNSQSSYVIVDAEIERDIEGIAKMRNFRIRSFEQPQVNFSGLGPLKWVNKLLMRPVVRFLDPIIKKAVEVTVRGIIEKKLPGIMAKVDFHE